MARSQKYDDQQIAQLKKNISILHVCEAHGIKLKKHGANDYVGQCPFHEEDEPSFIVTPGKNLFHCMGCNKGGSVIDLVMELDGITFREAVDKLMTSTGLVSRAADPSPQEQPSKEEPVPPERAAALLERTISIYEKNFSESPEARAYLESRGITDAALFSRFRIGASTGKFSEMLPTEGLIREDLKRVGILLDPIKPNTTPTKERFESCVVFPVFNEEGELTTVYGRSIGNGKGRHLYLPGRPTGIWNAQTIKVDLEIILTESVIDALSVMVAGFPNVISIQGTNGLKDADIESFARRGVTSVILLLDGDDAGGKAVGRLRPRLEAAGIDVTVKALPEEHDPNSYLQAYGAEALGQFIASDCWTPSEMNPTPEPVPDTDGMRAAAASGQAPGFSSTKNEEPSTKHAPRSLGEGGNDGFAVTYGLRTYNVLGLEKGPRKLRATVRVEHAGKLHVDTLDFYSSRSRRMLAQDLCRIFDESPETIEADITRLLQACEKQPVQTAGDSKRETAPPPMSPADRKDAEAFGKSPDLIERILADFETCGLVGEEPNKLLAYLAATSRKTDEPLSVLVLSSSGAGKTALQDTALQFVPPEELVKLTSLSGKALFYKDREALKHKVLSLEEGDGAQEATYAIRNLISAGELVIESTIKDLGTGRLTTMENRVEGPTSVFITTTDPDTDPETKSRFFVTSIDEGRDQTRKILAFQRQRQTLAGLNGNMAADVILKLHRNFQRLLKPVAVVNPFAAQLAYGDDRLQGRRDQPKYLNLIKAVAFLRQMQKPVSETQRGGKQVPYVLIDVEDIRIANRLAHEILGRSLDELSRPGRSLLLQLDEMVENSIKRLKKETPDHVPPRTAVTFSRREIREFSGWAHTRVHRYLKELVDLEYVIIDSGRNGTLCRYRLAYEGQGKNGERFMLGLTSPDQLELDL
jgi:DNA primase catalytic core